MVVVQTVVVAVLFQLFLEKVEDIERSLAGIILKSPSLERGRMSVERIDFRSGKGVDDVFVSDDGVVCRRCAEIQTQCRVGVLSEYTSLRKNRVFVGSRLVRVFVEERIGVLNHLGHRRTIGLRLIGTVLDVVLSVGKLVAHRTESREFKPFARTGLEFCLEFRVKNREVYVVVCEFVLDVERSVIARIELIRVESSRRSQGV